MDKSTSRRVFIAAQTLAAGAIGPILGEMKPAQTPKIGFASHGNERLQPEQFKLRGHRNAPCACGSGKKFKKCHGAAPTYEAPTVAEQPQAA